MRRCIECGRPYRGGLSAPSLLELALQELAEGDLHDEHVTDLTRIRRLIRAASDGVEEEMSRRAGVMLANQPLQE